MPTASKLKFSNPSNSVSARKFALCIWSNNTTAPARDRQLFLSPDYRKDDNGRLLSLARFLFMAEHIEYFDPIVIAEMRGVVDDHGHSPFWDAVGQHFFDIDFPKADYLSMVNKHFIAELMPDIRFIFRCCPAKHEVSSGKCTPTPQAGVENAGRRRHSASAWSTSSRPAPS